MNPFSELKTNSIKHGMEDERKDSALKCFRKEAEVCFMKAADPKDLDSVNT